METSNTTSVINKIEFWLVSVVFAIAVFVLVKQLADYDHYRYLSYDFGHRYNVPFSQIRNYFFPILSRYIVLYGCYLLLHFVITKSIFNKTNIEWNIIFTVILFLLVGLVYSITDTWLKAYLLYGRHINSTAVYARLFAKNYLTIFYGFVGYAAYTIVKYNPPTVIKNLSFKVDNFNAKIIRDCFIATICWFILFLIFTLGDFPDGSQIFMVFVASVSILLYGFSSLSLIPYVKEEGKGFGFYYVRVMLLLVVLLFAIFVITVFIFHDSGNTSSAVVVLNIIAQLIVVAPATWYIYEYRAKRSKEIVGLKTALGSSNANLDFLRSQINPHFLFNALNTLYGTSLQENAERTGEGIQKLGDMMRFMLQENMQEKISLTREVDYMNNYIDLQKLRTQTSPDINIQTVIDEQLNGLNIAPMLLIPFVENAFKHGISLREPSHIKISLQTKVNELFFDVYNSIHEKTGTDPERDKSGIGLENVRQRLQLLYPGQHELVIRESAKEFFIHLTIQLS